MDVACSGVYPRLLELSLNALSSTITSLINKLVLDNGIAFPKKIMDISLLGIDISINNNKFNILIIPDI